MCKHDYIFLRTYLDLLGRGEIAVFFCKKCGLKKEVVLKDDIHR